MQEIDDRQIWNSADLTRPLCKSRSQNRVMPDCNGEVRKKMTETVSSGYAEEIEAFSCVGKYSVGI